MLERALAAAALALLFSGDAVRLGWDAAGPWHLVFPYVWLFVLLESSRARRRTDDGVVFLAGASMAMLYGGVYAKDLQHGFHPLGVDWLGVLFALFDGGMTSVLALHVAERLRPRKEAEAPEMGLLTIIFLVFTVAAAAAVYGVKTSFNFYKADRMLDSYWLVADILFLAGAWVLARQARDRSEEGDDEGRADWIWRVAAFSVWLPGARFIGALCTAYELPDALMYFFVGGWTVAALVVFWRLWKERGHFDPTPVSSSRPALIAAGWRVAGSLLLILWLGADLNDMRTGGFFSTFVDLPSRALFAWAFLTGRLKI